jgi:hypothetical protein
MLAAIDFNLEVWRLVRIAIALLQPLLVLVLIAGLVLATAHLLTMIGTRWGDRRASSKAMLFSVAVHLLLVCGLIALIPEYRLRAAAHLAHLQEEPIRIMTPPEEFDAPSEQGSGGDAATSRGAPLFQQIPATETPDWKRIDSPPEIAAPARPLEKPTEAPPLTPQPTPDRVALPEPPAPQPQPTMPAEPAVPSEPQQARTQMNVESLPTQTQPEAAMASSAAPQRSTIPTLRTDEPEAAPRPARGSIDRLDVRSSPQRRAPDLEATPAPQAELMRAQDQDISRRTGPTPVPAAPELLGQHRTETAPAQSAMPVEPQLARTQPRSALPALESPGMERVRPSLPAASPAPAPLRPSQPGKAESLLPSVSDRPQLSRQDDPFLKRTERERVPSAYRLRTDEERDRAILKFGGSAETEEAVERSLKWLASVQSPDGRWDASEFGAGQVQIDEEGINRNFAGREADAGVTALAVLAFLGKLHTVDQGTYSPHVNRALRWLIGQQTSKRWGEGFGATDGFLGGNASDFEAMYCHAMATFALAEAYAMSRDNVDAQWLRPPLERAVSFIFDVQNPDGGWRYVKGQREGDMSIFGWQLMALKSAEAAGIALDESKAAQMRKFLSDRKLGTNGGLAGYRLNEQPTATMTAEALYCRQMLGLADNPAASQEAVQYLLSNLPQRTNMNLYYWYYGTLAMYQHGGVEWTQWNQTVRDLLLSEQRRSGALAGSWDPRGQWGGYGGRIYATAIATLSLEVYYRYLPLYRLNEN